MIFIRENQQSIPKTIKLLTLKIQKILDVDNAGLVTYFADEDFSKYPNNRYRDCAFYMNIKMGGIEEISPADIVCIMKDPNTIHFIWLSNLWKRNEITFTWLFAHELKHLKQNITTPNINEKTEQLKKLYEGSVCSKISQYNQYDLPVEKDADLTAKYVVEKLFPEKQVDDFFNWMISDGKRAKSFKHLQTVSGALCNDYEYQTDHLIRQLGPL